MIGFEPRLNLTNDLEVKLKLLKGSPPRASMKVAVPRGVPPTPALESNSTNVSAATVPKVFMAAEAIAFAESTATKTTSMNNRFFGFMAYMP